MIEIRTLCTMISLYAQKRSESIFPSTTVKKTENSTNEENGLFQAIRQEVDGSVSEYILKNGTNEINSENVAGWTPLHVAVNLNKPEVVEVLLKHGALVNKVNRFKNSPLHLAVKKNVSKDSRMLDSNLNVIQLLLEAGADRTAKDGTTRLTVPELVRFWDREELFSWFGINQGRRRSVQLVQNGSVKSAQFTLRTVHSPGISFKLKKVGKTEKQDDEIYDFDEEEGEIETERTTISDLLNDIESKCPNYQRLLHVYVEKGEDAIVKELIYQEDIDLNGLNDARLTPLQVAIQSGNWSTAHLLLQHPDTNPVLNRRDPDQAPFKQSVMKNQWELARIILSSLQNCCLDVLDLVLSYSGLGQGKNDDCQNLLLIKQTIHKIFKLEDEEIFIETFEKHLKSQRIGKMSRKSGPLRTQYITAMVQLVTNGYATEFRRMFFSLNLDDQKFLFIYICKQLSDDNTVLLVQAIVLEAEMYEKQSMLLGNKTKQYQIPERCSITRDKLQLQHKIQEISAQVIRIMKQTYGENEDSILTYLASTGKSEALSYMLTKNPAKAQVSKHELYAMENLFGQNLFVILQTQGSSLTRQKEEGLDLIREKYEDRKDALNKIKALLPTSSKGRDTLESLMGRYEMTPQEKIKIFLQGGIPFVFSTTLWAFDFSTDIKVSVETASCIFFYPSNNTIKGFSEENEINCSRFEKNDWLILSILSFLHIFIPFILFLIFDYLMANQFENIPIKSRKSIKVLGLIISPVTSKFMRMYQFIQYNLCPKGPDRNKQQSDLIAVSKLMVVIAVIETSLEANYQLYINFILFTPNILRILMAVHSYDFDKFDLQNRSFAIITSYVSLVWVNSAFKVHSKKGALDFKSSPAARLILILTFATEILARLVIFTFFSYTDQNQKGKVDWRWSLYFFYGHIFFCFCLNILLNDSSIVKHCKHPIFYMEALINAFSSIFTYSNYTIYNIKNRNQEHSRTFVRQIIFQIIFFIEFIVMLVYCLLYTPIV
ncbi:uncharacterized protein LOC111713856 isoform X4 [Eurytemora carolleeae]|uniref:uncharacterized protein LOC111713856 isoform X4 n=1 Tax=Eurytemora carolleeae TaxID=1294199 RepID=UPI000C7775D3|nr:uncharacterized protein LOC111713856 isoform X4 [Eurytemora carolleeae]|eukprot:XP_023344591.1 uncharacterized protein LOC111713856 isoform X4 [Eurytemora affinis]